MSKKVIASFVILLFAVSFISAVWWNPFSWGKDDVQLAPEVASGTFMEFVLSKGSHSYSIIVGEECFQLQFNGGALWVSGRSCDNWDVGLSGVGGSFNDLFPSRVISPQGMSTLIKIKKVEQDKLTVILSDYNAGSGVGYWFERGNTNYTHLLVDGDFYYKGTNGIWTKMETTRTSGGMNVLPSVGDKFEVPVTGFYDRINKNTILIYANGDVYTRNLNGNFVKDNSYLTQTGIPQGFKPILGYWHSIGSERINLWNKDGKLLVYNPNDNRWYDRTDSVVTGEPGKLPLGFKPVFGYWHPFTQSGGAINLWTSEGTIYYTTDGSTFNSMTLATANTNFRTLPGKDGKFEVPIVGFYDEIADKLVFVYANGDVYTRARTGAFVKDNTYVTISTPDNADYCGTVLISNCNLNPSVISCSNVYIEGGDAVESSFNSCIGTWKIANPGTYNVSVIDSYTECVDMYMDGLISDAEKTTSENKFKDLEVYECVSGTEGATCSSNSDCAEDLKCLASSNTGEKFCVAAGEDFCVELYETGNDEEVFDIVLWNSSIDSLFKVHNDTCISDSVLMEYYCTNDNMNNRTYTCEEGSCVDGACESSDSSICTSNTDCPGNLNLCLDGICTQVQCVANFYCTNATLPICDLTTNTCVANTISGCESNADCDDGKVCKLPAGQCVDCLTNDDCYSDEICSGNICITNDIDEPDDEGGNVGLVIFIILIILLVLGIIAVVIFIFLSQSKNKTKPVALKNTPSDNRFESGKKI
jgi:hypothetical protein